MSVKESRIKHFIREILLEEGILRSKIEDTKIDFGFQFSFPPGPKGQNMAVLKPLKKDLLIISLGTQIAEPHVKALGDKSMPFFINLRKILLLKNLLFRLDVQNYRYEINEQIFFDDENLLSKNEFFRNVRKVFSVSAYCNILLGDYCSGKVSADDFDKSKDFTSEFSLYS